MGVTDDGHRYDVVSSLRDAPPVVLEVHPYEGTRWPDDAPVAMVGQPFGMRHAGRMLMMRVVAAELNRMNGRLRLTCR